MLFQLYFQAKEFFSKLVARQEGQGLVEYALILVLIAIVVIAALLILGPTIANVFNKISTNLQAAPIN